MPYSPELFERTQEIIDNRRLDAERKAEEKRAAFEKEEPQYAKNRLIMIDSMRQVFQAMSARTDTEELAVILQEMKMKNLAAQDDNRRLLREHGMAEDALDPKYTCKKCSDYGYIETKRCECFMELLRQLAFEEAGKKSPLRFSSFEEFRLDYYSETVNPDFGCSPRQRMEDILELCREYAANFDLHSQNLLMIGETGLGKTHLSLAIAGEAIRKGYGVLYNSAQNIFSELEREHFSRSAKDGEFESLIFESDLLVIDDLGAEFSTQFTNAALYNIINTRINTARPTIINTNLNLQDLEDKYTRRISSRLIGEYLSLVFFGEDIRQKKNG
ncbi:MAG: ATP-binding protein [Clostridia bacterium]|nr:ATP-binding protein [Clostridia bacterium]MBR0509985.1 ATP-binding protein [Clostridia bacterium]